MTSDKTKERMQIAFHTLHALLRHLDNEQEQGKEAWEHKGELIRVCGLLRDEVGRENVMYPGAEEWFDGECYL